WEKPVKTRPSSFRTAWPLTAAPAPRTVQPKLGSLGSVTWKSALTRPTGVPPEPPWGAPIRGEASGGGAETVVTPVWPGAVPAATDGPGWAADDPRTVTRMRVSRAEGSSRTDGASVSPMRSYG